MLLRGDAELQVRWKKRWRHPKVAQRSPLDRSSNTRLRHILVRIFLLDFFIFLVVGVEVRLFSAACKRRLLNSNVNK